MTVQRLMAIQMGLFVVFQRMKVEVTHLSKQDFVILPSVLKALVILTLQLASQKLAFALKLLAQALMLLPVKPQLACSVSATNVLSVTIQTQLPLALKTRSARLKLERALKSHVNPQKILTQANASQLALFASRASLEKVLASNVIM
jgi:hypothetical protein